MKSPRRVLGEQVTHGISVERGYRATHCLEPPPL